MYTYTLAPLVAQGISWVPVIITVVIILVAIFILVAAIATDDEFRLVFSFLFLLYLGAAIFVSVDAYSKYQCNNRYFANERLDAELTSINSQSGYKSSPHLYATYLVDGKYITFNIATGKAYSKHAIIYKNEACNTDQE